MDTFIEFKRVAKRFTKITTVGRRLGERIRACNLHSTDSAAAQKISYNIRSPGETNERGVSTRS